MAVTTHFDRSRDQEPTHAEIVSAFKDSFVHQLAAHLVKDGATAGTYDHFLSIAYSVAEQLAARWLDTQRRYHRDKAKRVYYLSMEYLLGRSLECHLINLGLYEACREALADMGYNLSDLLECEADAGLGNGGLGRLAACFLDSMATLGIPAQGYGLRYDYGLFRQRIVEGRQVEDPEHWLAMPNPWEVGRPGFTFTVKFGGRVSRPFGGGPRDRSAWVDTSDALATPYDMPVPGYRNDVVNTLRLWNARATEEFNLACFNSGDFLSACECKVHTENITKVLYPNDHHGNGRELRLKQEYFLVSSSLQDILARFKLLEEDWSSLPDHAAIQLNDTHPALAIPELMRLLIDEEGVSWHDAWSICTQTFAYTNHTIMPEALEEWPVSLIERLLPRHLEIIYLINHYFLLEVSRRYPGDVERLRRMSIINEDGEKRVRMAHLSLVGSHAVNGVAALHTQLLRESVLRDFAELWPWKFSNKTNGITPRRWLRAANPALSGLITEAIGDGWLTDLHLLRHLEPFAGDASFREEWRRIKAQGKEPLIRRIAHSDHLLLNPDAIFDVQVKRIHEYKRQLLFALYIISTYLHIKEHPGEEVVPRVCLLGGKAAPAYDMARRIIHFINRIAETVNADPETRGLLNVVFLPDYRVSLAEQLVPAANLSEQISTAGREASGTGCMKFALNGALTIGTLDGANIEIAEEVGEENIFIFGMTAPEVAELKARGYRPNEMLATSPELARVMQLIACDFFSPGDPGLFRPIYDALVSWDEYCVLADFDAYLACQQRVSAAYLDTERWARMSILNVARCGKFSSDRTIAEYAGEIWRIPVPSSRDATPARFGMG